jgi:hypothetical protein
MASPVACCHQLSVRRSYITRSLARRLPVVPKSWTTPSISRSKTSAVLHSGQNVTTTATPPRVSFTISCHMRTASGYARASSPTTSEITGDRSRSQRRASAMDSYRGASIAGMPSFGGPPPRNSPRLTLAFVKSVRQPAVGTLRSSGSAICGDGDPDGSGPEPPAAGEAVVSEPAVHAVATMPAIKAATQRRDGLISADGNPVSPPSL